MEYRGDSYFLVAFRHVGFPLFAKLGLAQALDTNLDQPLAAFAAVTAGVFAYFLPLCW